MAKYQVTFTGDNGIVTRCIVLAYSRYRALIKAVLETSIRRYKDVSVKCV